MALGLFGAVAMLSLNKTWLWAFISFCGAMMTYFQTVQLIAAYKDYMNAKKKTEELLAGLSP